MTSRKVDDVEVISNAGTVYGWEIVSENFERVLDSADSDACKKRKEVVWLALWVFADLA